MIWYFTMRIRRIVQTLCGPRYRAAWSKWNGKTTKHRIAALAGKALRKSWMLFAVKQHGDALLDSMRAKIFESCTFAQHREDLVLCELLRAHLYDGYYVDVGANHPSKLSNTYKLFVQGMRGITVEPNEIFSALHRRYRPEDICISAGCGPTEGVACFYERSYHAVSSVLDTSECVSDCNTRVIARKSIPIITLAGLLRSVHLRGRSHFALLSVDSEGFDIEVLRGNDWDSFRPLYVIAEFESPASKKTLLLYMETVGYRFEQLLGCNILLSRVK